MSALLTTHPLLPSLVTALPGPRAMDIIERDRAVLSPSYTRCYPLVMKRGEGAIVEDVDAIISSISLPALPWWRVVIRILA